MVNLGLTVVKVGALLWVVREAGMVLTPVALGMFLLARRVGNTGGCFLQLGMSQGLVRYVAMHQESPAGKRYFVSLAGSVWGGMALILVPVFLLTGSRIEPWLFPGPRVEESLAFWTGMLMLASVGHYLAHSTLVAERRMVWGNLVDLAGVSGFLLAYILWAGNRLTPMAALRFQALSMIILSALFLVIYVLRPGGRGVGIQMEELQRKKNARAFLSFALPRGLVAFLDMALLMLGPWLLRAEVEEAGFLIVSLTLMRVLQVGIMPIAQVASVVTAQLLGRGDEGSIEEGVKLLFGGVLYLGGLMSAVVIPWGHAILEIWLVDVGLASRVFSYFLVVGWGLLPYALFQGLKGIIEMRWIRPLNLVTLLAANGVHLFVFYPLAEVFGPEVAVRWALLLSLTCLGLLSSLFLIRYLRPWSHWGFGRLVGTVACLGLSNYFVLAETTPLWALLWSAASAVVAIYLLWRVLPAPYVLSLEAFLLESLGRRERAVS